MALYSIFVLAESDISLSGGAVLDGVTQGDGSHLVTDPPTTLTIDSKDWVEIAIDDSGGETNFADNDGGQRLDGDQELDGVLYTDGTRVEAEYRFIVEDPATGIRYEVVAFNINNSSPAYATVEGLAFVDQVPPAGVALNIVSASEGPRNSGSEALDESRYVPICFTAGTRIATPEGGIAVEALSRGDEVLGHDGRRLELRAVLHSRFTADDLRADPRLRPVTIALGALAAGVPTEPLAVSRQHRMLVSSEVAERMFGVRDVLIPAHKLTVLRGVAVADSDEDVHYVHLLFDQHEIVLANGAPTESLFVGPEALKNLPDEAREELRRLFPELNGDGFSPPAPARLIPEGRRQKRLVARHAKSGKHLLT